MRSNILHSVQVCYLDFPTAPVKLKLATPFVGIHGGLSAFAALLALLGRRQSSGGSMPG